jgi:hypothetical protein
VCSTGASTSAGPLALVLVVLVLLVLPLLLLVFDWQSRAGAPGVMGGYCRCAGGFKKQAAALQRRTTETHYRGPYKEACKDT